MQIKPPPVRNEFPELEPRRRLRELILYISRISIGDKTFGKVKLAKLLYLSDRASFRRYGVPITGALYRKLAQGPVPKDFFDLLEKMEQDGDIAIAHEPVADVEHDRQRVIALRPVEDLELFSGRDIATVVEVVKQYRNWSGTRLSKLSHGLAWQVVDMNEPISYESGLISDEPVTPEEIEYAREMLARYGDAY